MAIDQTDLQQVRQVYSNAVMTRATATLRAAQLWNRNHEAELQRARQVVLQDPKMTLRRARRQVTQAQFREFGGTFSEIETTPTTLRFNRQYEHQSRYPMDEARVSVVDQAAQLGMITGKLMAQELDHDVLGYAVRGDATDGSPGSITGSDTLVPTRNSARYGSDDAFIPLSGANAGITQGSDAATDGNAHLALTAMKQIQMQMMLNSHLKTGDQSFGDPIAFMMPATWRNIMQSAESMNIEVHRLPIFEGRDVTPEGYGGTVYGINCFLINPSYPDGTNSGQAFFTVNQDGRLDGSLYTDTDVLNLSTNQHDNRMMTRYTPTDRTDTTANTLRNHACIIAGFNRALTYAQTDYLTKSFSPAELQSATAYKGWQFGTSFEYMRYMVEPDFMYLAEIQCAPTSVNTGGA